MSDEKSKQPPNIHSDYSLDLTEAAEDCRPLIAFHDPQEGGRLGKLTALPTSYSDKKQRERRPDKVIKAEVLDDAGKVIGERIYLFEFKSEIRKTALLLQLLDYMAILWATYLLPVRAIVVYTGKRRLRQNGRINFREYMRSKNPVVDEHDLDFSLSLLNVFGMSVAMLQERAELLAPGLYLASRIFDIDEEVVITFFRMCAQLPKEERERQLEKGCTFIVKYAPEFNWGRLISIEQKIFPEEEWLVARLKFSREAYGDEQREQGIELGIVKGRAEGKAEGLAEGKGEERRDIAIKMIRKGKSDAEISELTGLSKKELALLKRGLKE